MTSLNDFQSVVIVDDDPEVRRYLDKELRKYGYSPKLVSSVAEAELLASRGEVQFVIDLEMERGTGDVGGLVLLTKLRRKSEWAFLGIYSDFADSHEKSAMELGADFVLPKGSHRGDAALLNDAMLRKRLAITAAKEAQFAEARAETEPLLTEGAVVIIVGSALSLISWRTGLRFHVTWLQQAAAVPAVMALAWVVIRAEIGSHRKQVGRSRAFRIYRQIRRFIWLSILSGIIYEIIRGCV